MKRNIITCILCLLTIAITNCSPNIDENFSDSINDDFNSNYVINTKSNYQNSMNSSINYENSCSNIINNLESLDDFKKKGFETIEDQSFWVEFKNWGNIRFVSIFYRDVRRKFKFCLVDENGLILYLSPDFIDGWWFNEIRAISFKDVNKDGLKDIIIIADYLTGVGSTGAIPFPICGVYFQHENEFINITALDEQINNAKKNESISMVLHFLEDKQIDLRNFK